MEYASLQEKPADDQKMLEIFGLGDLKKSFVNKLSGGERQKLSVVLALIGNPEIVFLDELTTGLDVAARRDDRHRFHNSFDYSSSSFWIPNERKCIGIYGSLAVETGTH